VVIHDIEGPALSAVRWFQDPRAKVSAHYVVDGEGRVWQQVRERDVAWHAGNGDVNRRSVGIEHEGYAYRPGFFSHGLYEGSARLVRSITTRNNIPRDRSHIIAHAEVPHPTEPGRVGGRSGHTDPGPYWDWDYFMALVRNDARVESVQVPSVVFPGQQLPITVTLVNTGDDPWPGSPAGRPGPAFAARAPVYLGVRPTQPLAASSASGFYDRPTWSSPRFAALPQGTEDVPPGGRATFSFSLRGPLTLGTVEERFRLTRVRTAPYAPVPFGPEMKVAVRVNPWAVIREAQGEGFTAPGWQARPGDTWPLAWRKFPAPEAEPARWTATLPLAGEWEVFARWTPASGRVRQALYTVETADGPRTVRVDQRKGGGWRPLGRFRFEGTKPEAIVSLGAEPGARGIAVAETLLFRGPYPAQDAEPAPR